MRAMLSEALERFDDHDIFKMDGFDHCILGVAEGAGSRACLVYDVKKVIDTLMRRDDMSEPEAWEWYEHNMRSAYMGEGTPLFIEEQIGYVPISN